ncbi:shikimate kinase [Pseudoblastomonas halimionae]|uniref:Shikimate kinase n=1 Tax=Alteriqipengyuania halimionae TaxID=1926630 RepID=A0A6I4U020_9SPHN|nr:shikimate kinase [Alteriqipengyuania halimionae]MXP09330.1 shikimate kinase [Alteriqipengyuania halimionae]
MALTSSPELGDLAARLDRPIVLVGLMGAGKSTVGRKLADMLGVEFVDVDHEIEAAANLTVGEIFERFGEPHFRDGERRVFARLIGESQGRGMVIAAGGGAFSDAGTRALIVERAIAVWLDSDDATLAERATRRDTRPLLRDGDPEAKLAELRAKRRADYGVAPIWVKSGRGAHHRVAIDIARSLEMWIERWIG